MDRIITEELIEETAAYPAANLTRVRLVHRATGFVLETAAAGIDHRAVQTARDTAFRRLNALLAA